MTVLNTLPVFEAAAHHQSFSKAADELGMAQPSVSRFISILEDILGIQLFERHHKRIKLSSQGIQLLDATSLGLGHIRSVVESFRMTGTERSLVIGCTHGFAHMWILPRLERLKELLPEREIRITTVDYGNRFPSGEVDLEVRFGGHDFLKDDGTLLFDELAFIVCSPEYAKQHKLLGRQISPEEVLGLNLLHQDFGQYGWICWSKWFEAHDIEYTPQESVHLINNYAFVLQAAMEGRGVALAWSELLEPHLSNHWLVTLQGLKLKTGNGYYLAFSEGFEERDIIRQWIKTA